MADSLQGGPGGRQQTAVGSVGLLLFSALLVGGLLCLQGRIGFDWTDEGFLWYGAIHTSHGSVPLRDFYSYDPGRYLWAAAWARLLGDGILALRLSTAVFQVFGLYCGLLAARRVVSARIGLLLVGVSLVLWMFPRHKLFESSLAMVAVYVILRLLEKPSGRSWFAAGIATGLVLLFGKNHGLYWSLAFFALLLFRHFRLERGCFVRNLITWSAGAAVGCLPLLVMMLTVPGFFRSYLDSILFFLHQGRTNSPLAIPWPWRAGDAQFTLGLAFLVLPLFYLLATVLVWRTDAANLDRRRLAVAALCVGIFYLHHAFSRADAAHLGQSIHPALLGLVALPLRWEGWARRLATGLVASLLAFLTLFVALPQSYLFHQLAKERRGFRYETCEVAGDRLVLPAGLAQQLDQLRVAVNRRLAATEPLLILPHFPGLYPFLSREAPIWDIYMIWPAQGGSDEQRIAEIEARKVRWVLLGSYGEPDGLRFRATHPTLVAYLDRWFAPVSAPDLPDHFVLLKESGERRVR